MSTLKSRNTNSETIGNQSTFIQHVHYEHFIAGISGGVVSSLILQPLDLLKIRFEVNNELNYNPKYKGIIDGLTTIFNREGIRGLYRGAVPSLVGAGVSWGLYFYFYSAIKTLKQCGNKDSHLTPTQHLVAASEAGILTLILTNPIWVCKTRLCLQSQNQSSHIVFYNGMIDTLVKLYKTEGIRGWYRGFIPGLFGVSHGAIQFMLYEQMKSAYSKYNDLPLSSKLGVTEYLTFAASSKSIAVCVTYPYQVVRARLQNQFYSFDGVWDCIKKAWVFEGWKVFYKGLGTNLVRVVPATMVTFVTYENISHFLISLKESN